jgi:hypothetical protein
MSEQPSSWITIAFPNYHTRIYISLEGVIRLGNRRKIIHITIRYPPCRVASLFLSRMLRDALYYYSDLPGDRARGQCISVVVYWISRVCYLYCNLEMFSVLINSKPPTTGEQSFRALEILSVNSRNLDNIPRRTVQFYYYP